MDALTPPLRARRIFVLALLGAGLLPAEAAAPLSAAARSEIEGLLTRLETSGCQFNRNGTWYPAPEAKAHLLRKLKYLEDRDLVQSTEQFIELAASTSSRSGKPYLVKCGAEAPVESGTWMRSQLRALRAGAAAKSAPR